VPFWSFVDVREEAAQTCDIRRPARLTSLMTLGGYWPSGQSVDTVAGQQSDATAPASPLDGAGGDVGVPGCEGAVARPVSACTALDRSTTSRAYALPHSPSGARRP
jgi:hypothetical protein